MSIELRVVSSEALTIWASPDTDGAGPAEDAWRQQALCKGKIDLFFGAPRERPERRIKREALARQYCAVCPALIECRFAARTNGENGFWGGESEEERAAAGYPPNSISRRGVLAAARIGRADEAPAAQLPAAKLVVDRRVAS